MKILPIFGHLQYISDQKLEKKIILKLNSYRNTAVHSDFSVSKTKLCIFFIHVDIRHLWQ